METGQSTLHTGADLGPLTLLLFDNHSLKWRLLWTILSPGTYLPGYVPKLPQNFLSPPIDTHLPPLMFV